MAVATARFAEVLSKEAPDAGAQVRIVRISADGTPSRARHHLQRVARVAGASAAMLRDRRSLVGVYVSADAGYGMAYTIILSLFARSFRVPIFVNHHSGSYYDRSLLRLRLLCHTGGRYATQLVGCPRARMGFDALYPGASVAVMPSLSHVQLPDQPGRRRRQRSAGRPLRLGHMSNLSVQKGLAEVFETAQSAAELGLDVALTLAGPPATPADEEQLRDLLARSSVPVNYLGPVLGESRESFFADIDIFLFPSRYVHECFALVLGEALTRGSAVVAFESTCMSQELIGTAGLVVGKSQPFSESATRWMLDLDDERWNEIETGTAQFVAACNRAQDTARTLARAMLHGERLTLNEDGTP